jgi:hypothetical protein
VCVCVRVCVCVCGILAAKVNAPLILFALLGRFGIIEVGSEASALKLLQVLPKRDPLEKGGAR